LLLRRKPSSLTSQTSSVHARHLFVSSYSTVYRCSWAEHVALVMGQSLFLYNSSRLVDCVLMHYIHWSDENAEREDVSSWKTSWLGGRQGETSVQTTRFMVVHAPGHVPSLSSQSFCTNICRESVEAAEFNICSWSSMNVSAGPPVLSLTTSVGRKNLSCILQLHCLSVCDWPVSWSVQSLETSLCLPGWGIKETESHCAITNCTLRPSGTVPAPGMSNPQWGLCHDGTARPLLMYCLFDG
jgi:hypothetical protein